MTNKVDPRSRVNANSLPLKTPKTPSKMGSVDVIAENANAAAITSVGPSSGTSSNVVDRSVQDKKLLEGMQPINTASTYVESENTDNGSPQSVAADLQDKKNDRPRKISWYKDTQAPIPVDPGNGGPDSNKFHRISGPSLIAKNSGEAIWLCRTVISQAKEGENSQADIIVEMESELAKRESRSQALTAKLESEDDSIKILWQLLLSLLSVAKRYPRSTVIITALLSLSSLGSYKVVQKIKAALSKQPMLCMRTQH